MLVNMVVVARLMTCKQSARELATVLEAGLATCTLDAPTAHPRPCYDTATPRLGIGRGYILPAPPRGETLLAI